MKKLMFLVIFALMFMGLSAQDYDWTWAQRAGGPSYDSGQSIAVDAAGNSYVSGVFQSTAIFGTTSLTSNGYNGNADIFVAKMDTNGNWLWAKKAGGTSDDSGNSVAVDADGNSYVSGYFSGSATFGTISLTSSGSSDIFVTKLDPNGNWLWAKQAGGLTSDSGNAIAVDDTGNCYISGSFYDHAMFGTTQLYCYGSFDDSDIFVAKLDTNGNWLWAKSAGLTSNGMDPSFMDSGNAIAVDSAGNCYISGYFDGHAVFGNTGFTSSGSYDIFVAKLDTNGNWIWAKQAGGASMDIGYAIAVNSTGNSFVSGCFAGTATFGTTSMTSMGSTDIFVAKLDTNGNWVWAKQVGSTSDDGGEGVAVDAAGNSYVSGSFSETATFGTINITSSGSRDIFVAKLDTNGNWLWAKRVGGISYDYGSSIAADITGICHVVGCFQGTATFGTANLTSNGSYDIFVAKLEPVSPPVVNFTANVTIGFEPLQVQFTDISDAVHGTISSWQWSFGDGGTSPLQHPLHTYQNTGLYSVILQVTNSYDYTSTMVWQDYITVLPSVPVLQLQSSNDLDFASAYLDEATAYQQVVICNRGGINLEISNIYWSSGQHFEYYRAHPEQPILPNMEETFFVRFVPHTVGTLRDTLCVVNNSTNQPLLRISVSGVGLYVPPQTPEEVNITINGYDAVLTWDAVTENTHHQPLIPDYYFVYFNGSPNPDGVYYFQGMSPTNQFTHPYVAMGAEYMFYRAKAIKLYPPIRGESIDMQELKSRLQQVLKVGMTESEVSKALDHLWDERQ